MERKIRYREKINALKIEIDILEEANEKINKTIIDLNAQIKSKAKALSLQEMLNRLESKKQQYEDKIAVTKSFLKTNIKKIESVKPEFAAIYPLAERKCVKSGNWTHRHPF